MTTQAGLLWGAGAALALTLLAAGADHRRSRRRNLDRAGWVPWTPIQLFGFLTAIVLVALAFSGKADLLAV